MFRRIINPIKSNSFFLFGARGTGKTTFLRGFLPESECIWIDLLEYREEAIYRRNPDRIIDLAKSAGNKVIIIDEVQKVPKILDPVHKAIEQFKTNFVLTGSSARKLKKGAANLLAGRAFVYNMFPLTFLEIGDQFDLQFALEWGTLPKIHSFGHNQNAQTEFLDAYAQTYLKEEVFSEQLVRDISPFKDFIEIAAFENGHLLNYEKMAKDIGVDGKTVASYYQILEDTLVGYIIPPFHRSIRKRQKLKPKFYFFDTGVARSLQQRLRSPLLPRTNAFGDVFEHFIILEIIRLNSYTRKKFNLFFIEISEGGEIDLILEKGKREYILIEIISKDAVSEKDLKHLKAIKNDFPGSKKYLLSQDRINRDEDDIHIRNWTDGLKEIFL